MDIKDLVIYRNLEHQELFRDIAHLMGYAQGGQSLTVRPAEDALRSWLLSTDLRETSGIVSWPSVWQTMKMHTLPHAR